VKRSGEHFECRASPDSAWKFLLNSIEYLARQTASDERKATQTDARGTRRWETVSEHEVELREHLFVNIENQITDFQLSGINDTENSGEFVLLFFVTAGRYTSHTTGVS
jgi:hypothetical protein